MGWHRSCVLLLCDDCVLCYPCVFVGPKPFWLTENWLCVSELIKATETIESLSQQDLLYRNLENCAESRRGKLDKSMLAEVAEAAVASAEMQTQPGDLPHCRRQRGGRAREGGGSYSEENGCGDK